MTISEHDLKLLGQMGIALLTKDDYFILRILANKAIEHLDKTSLSRKDIVLAERGLAILTNTHEDFNFFIGFFKGALDNYGINEKYLWNIIHYFISDLIELHKGGVL